MPGLFALIDFKYRRTKKAQEQEEAVVVTSGL
jgi:hypothetical protein